MAQRWRRKSAIWFFGRLNTGSGTNFSCERAPKSPKPVEPLSDGVARSLCEVERCPEPERRAPCCGVVVAHCGNPEDEGRLGHRLEIVLVDAGIPDRLTPHERPVPDEVGEKYDLGIVPVAQHPW